MTDPAKSKKRTLLFLAAAAVTELFNIILYAARDSIVVSFGIRTYNLLALICASAFGLSSAGLVISLVLFLIGKKKEKKEQEEELRKKIEEEQAKKEAVLKYKGKLDPEQVRSSLNTVYGDWTSKISLCGDSQQIEDFHAVMSKIFSGMKTMDSYQEKLNYLLNANGADALRDTEDILDNAEQFIYRNVRKLLNIMTISSPENPDDLNTVLSAAHACAGENSRLLDTTREFMVSVTEFLNTQNEDDDSLYEMNAYKSAIQSQISARK